MGVEKKEKVLPWPMLLQFSITQKFSAAPLFTTFQTPSYNP